VHDLLAEASVDMFSQRRGHMENYMCRHTINLLYMRDVSLPTKLLEHTWLQYRHLRGHSQVFMALGGPLQNSIDATLEFVQMILDIFQMGDALGVVGVNALSHMFLVVEIID